MAPKTKFPIKQVLKCSNCGHQLSGAVVEFVGERTCVCPTCGVHVILPDQDEVARKFHKEVDKQLDRAVDKMARQLRRAGAKVKIRKR